MNASDKEHVTPYFYRYPDKFRILNIAFPGLRGDVQLSVDTAEDLVRIGQIIGRLGAPYWQHGLKSILQVFDSLNGTNDKNT